jgi:decaprenylphospho-beta-D-ribofuranose 2-oxidase
MSAEPIGSAPGRSVVTGWGRGPAGASLVHRPADVAELRALLGRGDAVARERGLALRGLGRAVGDPGQCAGGRVIDCTRLNGVRAEAASATVTAEAGADFGALLRTLLPLGLFPPVTPGTRHVTVGGAVAADIHGKNHHVDSSFGAHLLGLTLATPDGRLRELQPHGPGADLFWATVGGMGLTGAVAEARFRAHPVTSAHMRVDTDRLDDFDAVLAAMSEPDTHRYSVAWIDLLARGRRTGRSVLTRADHAEADELPAALRHTGLARAGLSWRPRPALDVPMTAPAGLLNPWSLRAFNSAYFHRAPRRRRGEIQDLAGFFYPLDALGRWHRLYGPRGLVQYQFVVPLGAEVVLRRIVERFSLGGAASFLAVLKRFGAQSGAPLSFPMPGWTLAVDVPAGLPGLGALLRRMDAWVAAAGGRVYLAKDSRTRPEMIRATYPRLEEWRAVRRRVDPEGILCTDLARRLELR